MPSGIGTPNVLSLQQISTLIYMIYLMLRIIMLIIIATDIIVDDEPYIILNITPILLTYEQQVMPGNKCNSDHYAGIVVTC
jgi:hypothetical protein